jgi:pimeloyl-ACP methyl ester carboxylesterase
LTLATSISAIVLLLTIVNSFLHLQQDPKGCAMSYMMPMFARFSDFDTEHTRFASKYSLYMYREGGVDEDTRVKGIPVLFIPGNAGSYKQIRPIAAEAAHYFQDVLRLDANAVADGKRPLDVFTVDFNEELVAFHGQTLLDQAEYLNEAVAYILALYHNPQRSDRETGLPNPKSVIIIGHSMGGAVARAMPSMPNYQENTINTILTLAAPHARPPVSFDPAMVAAYKKINAFWRDSFLSHSHRNPLDEMSLVSVAGGGLDTMIPSEYASLTSLVPDTHGFTVFTSSIPNVWTAADHLAIMWCDQVRKALVKAIFDVIDARRPTQTKSRAERMQALRKRLLTGMEPIVAKKAVHLIPSMQLTLEHDRASILSEGERLMISPLSGSQRAHVMPIPSMQSSEKGAKFTLLTDQALDSNDGENTLSVFLCNPSSHGFGQDGSTHTFELGALFHNAKKLACTNIASDVSLLPASRSDSQNAFDQTQPFSYVQYDLATISAYKFIAVVETPTDSSNGWLFAEFSNEINSSVLVNQGHHELLLSGLAVELPAIRPLMTEIKIPEIHSTLFAYRMAVDRRMCDQSVENFTPLVRQYIARPYESKYFVNTQGGNINVHGLSPYMPPPLHGGGATEGLSLQLWTDPTCNSTVTITLKVDVLGSAGKLVMRYRTIFAAFPMLVIALVLRKQFSVYDATGVFMSFTQSMDQCIRTSLPAIFMALTFFGIAMSKSSQSVWPRQWLGASANDFGPDFTVNDLMLGTPDPFFWFLVPLFAIISVGICIAANYVILLITHTLVFVFTRARNLMRGAASTTV